MNKQQLTQLEERLRTLVPFSWEYYPTLPPALDDDSPREGFITFLDGQFELDVTIWTGYYCSPATQYQPADEGWADDETICMRSPFLTDLLTELEDREVALPYSALEVT